MSNNGVIESICWGCLHAVPDPAKDIGCSWSLYKRLVPGAETIAEEKMFTKGRITTHIVTSCPEYKPSRPGAAKPESAKPAPRKSWASIIEKNKAEKGRKRMAAKKFENTITAAETTRTEGETVFVTGMTVEVPQPDNTWLRRKLQVDAVNWQVYLANQTSGGIISITEEDVAALLLIHEAVGLELSSQQKREVSLARMKGLIQVLEVTSDDK